MKTLVTLGLAFLSSVSMAGAAAHDVPSKPGVDVVMATHLVADASRLGATGDTVAMNSVQALPAGMRWAAEESPEAPADSRFGRSAAPVETGPLAIVLGLLVLLLARPLAGVLRRREQQRRAAALASAIAHTPRR